MSETWDGDARPHVAQPVKPEGVKMFDDYRQECRDSHSIIIPVHPDNVLMFSIINMLNDLSTQNASFKQEIAHLKEVCIAQNEDVAEMKTRQQVLSDLQTICDAEECEPMRVIL